MYERIKYLIIFCIAKSGLILITVVFFTFQCSDPLSFLFADTTLRVDKNKVLLYEGEANTIGFRLNSKPFNDEKFVTLTASLECEGFSESERTSRAIIDRKTITWRINNWATWQKIVIVAIENDKQEISKTCKLLLEPIQSNDVGFDKLKMKEIPITILDNDGDANIKVSTQNLALAEADSANEVDSANVSYTIHLTNKPRDEVIINITHKDDLPSWFSLPKLIVGGTPATSVTFTTENYNQPQTITVAYPNDMYADGNFIHTLQHTITTIDPVYKEIAPINLPTVTLDLRDNDTLNFQTINNQDNALISSLEGKEGMTQSFKIKPSISLREGSIIKLDVEAANRNSDRIQLANSSSPYSLNPVRLTFKNNNPQIVNIHFIDDDLTTEGSLATTINYSVISSGSDLPIVDGVSLSPQGGFASAGGSLMINIIEKDTPDLRVTNCYTGDSGINRLIEGGSITCNIHWDIALPVGGAVDVKVVPDISLGTILPINANNVLRFARGDGTNAKSITIFFKENDNIDQTNYDQTVTFSTDQMTGPALGYEDKEKRVILNIIDDDTDSFSGSSFIPNQAVNVISSLREGDMREGDSGALKICLTSDPKITADPKNSMDPPVDATVSFTLQSSDSGILNITNPTFSLNGKGCHNFNLTAPNNNIIDAARSVTLTISNFNNDGDTDYTLAQLSSVIGDNIIISIIDDDVPSVTISTSSLTILEGDSAQRYRIGLAESAPPSSRENVVIDLSSNHALLTVAPAQFALNSTNRSQDITVTRVNNDIAEDDGLTGTISHTLNPSTGASYNIASVQEAIRDANITVTMNDNDTAGFIFTPTNRQMNAAEGESVYYAVQLRSKPTENVILGINPDFGLTGSATSLIFTPSNWSTPKTVVVQIRENSYVGDYDTQVNHSISSADSKYDSLAIAPVTIHVANNDGGIGNVIISNNVLTFDDTAGKTGATYTISLSHNPALDTDVKVMSTITSKDDNLQVNPPVLTLQVSPSVVTFTSSAASPQTITVKRKDDASNMIMADITGIINHRIVITRTNLNTNSDSNITTFQGDSTVNVTVNSTIFIIDADADIDADHDGLIDIKNAAMLNNMRYNLAGTSYKTSATQATGNKKGCLNNVCNGYELTANIDLLDLLDTNENGSIDTTTVSVSKNAHADEDEQITVIDTGTGKDTSWVPIGDAPAPFTSIFEGNNHTIANLWVNISSSTNSVYGGLFGVTRRTIIRNVEIVSGSIHSSVTGPSFKSYSGGLVGYSDQSLTITNCTFSGNNRVSSIVTRASYSGGLVGFSDDPGAMGGGSESLTIANCVFEGSIFSSIPNSSLSDKKALSGGLVGDAGKLLTITNSAFLGGSVSSFIFASSVSDSDNANQAISGGLVGCARKSSTITNSSFFGGSISSFISDPSTIAKDDAWSGGLIACSATLPLPTTAPSTTASLTINNSVFFGSGEISSSSPPSHSHNTESYSGGLVAHLDSSFVLTAQNSYWNSDAPQRVNGSLQSSKRARGDAETEPSGTFGLTLMELKAITSSTLSAPSPSDLPHSTTDNTKAWDLGTVSQLPAIKKCVNLMVDPNTFVVTCGSYGALLPRQR